MEEKEKKEEFQMETEVFSKEEEESKKMKSKPNYQRNDNKKKIIIYIVLGLAIALLIGTLVYLLVIKKDDNKTTTPSVIEKEDDKDKVNDKDETNLGYVSCDDNTSLLNVRNSTSGDIIDGLSCFKEVKIDEELEGTENCKKWYKISYTKRDNNYTGYACATYIKKKTEDNKVDERAVEKLIEKANDYYIKNLSVPYCGKTSDTKNIEYKEGENSFTGYYVKSEYKSLEELKKYLLTFLDESLIESELKLSDINNKKMYDNYYEIDGNLYCRNYSGKGVSTRYTGNYDFEIESISDNKVNVNIAYEYLTEESTCDSKDLSKCTNSNFTYKISKIVIKKEDSNYIITKMDFPK